MHDRGHVLRKALEFEVKGKRKRGRERRKWRRRARVLVWRKRMPRIEQDREWELKRLLLKWGKSGHPRLHKPGSKLDDDDGDVVSRRHGY